MPLIMLLYEDGSPDDWGIIPSFLKDNDPRPARYQIDDRYIAGWQPFEGFEFDPKTLELTYPGDPPMKPLSSILLHSENIMLYPHAWVLIMQLDGSWEIARLD